MGSLGRKHLGLEDQGLGESGPENSRASGGRGGFGFSYQQKETWKDTPGTVKVKEETRSLRGCSAEAGGGEFRPTDLASLLCAGFDCQQVIDPDLRQLYRARCFDLAFPCHLLTILPPRFPNMTVTCPISGQVYIFSLSYVDVRSGNTPCPGWVSSAQTLLPPPTLGCSPCEMGLFTPVQPPSWYHQVFTD